MCNHFTALRALLPAVALGLLFATPMRAGAEDAASAGVRLAQAPVQIASVEIGRVDSLTGKVFAIRQDIPRQQLAKSSTVFQRDEIETSTDGSVGLIFLDGTKFSLGPDAKMVLDEMIYDPGAKSGSSVMSVLKGSFVFITGEVASISPDAMKVKTPTGTLGIRGTTVGCAIAASETSCVLLPSSDGKDHQLLFSNTVDSITLSEPYQMVTSSGSSAALRVSKVTPDDVRRMLAPALGTGIPVKL